MRKTRGQESLRFRRTRKYGEDRIQESMRKTRGQESMRKTEDRKA